MHVFFDGGTNIDPTRIGFQVIPSGILQVMPNHTQTEISIFIIFIKNLGYKYNILGLY